MIRLLRAILVLAISAAGLALPQSAPAQVRDLSGLCLDLREDGCTERFLRFRGLTIDFCEETCTLTAPTAVRGMEATLFDMRCQSDMPTDIGGRVMVLRQTDSSNASRLLFIDRRDVFAIVRCPYGY